MLTHNLGYFVKPDPFPGLPVPAVGPGGPKIDRKSQTRIYLFIFPKVCRSVPQHLLLADCVSMIVPVAGGAGVDA